MRKAAIVALLLVALALSGCSGKDAPDGEDGTDGAPRTTDGGGRTSEAGGDGNSTDPPHTTVAIYDGALELLLQQTATIDVEVPADVTNVDFTVSGGANNAVLSGFRIELSGCGVFDQGQTSTSIGSVTLKARLCKDASSGPATITVSNTGLLQGTLRVEGQVPKAPANATA